MDVAREVNKNGSMLWYRQPARGWVEALPVGNGRLGAMVFGGVVEERLSLNEDTLWSGAPKDWNNPLAVELLVEARAAIRDGEYGTADSFCRKMQGPFAQSYLPLGDLRLHFALEGEAENYHRELDLDNAVATTRFSIGEATFTREVLSSAPDQAILVHLACDQPGMIGLEITLDSPLHYSVFHVGNDGLEMRGKCPSHVDPSYLRSENPVRYDDPPGEGMEFAVDLRAVVQGGQVEARNGKLVISRADEALLVLTAATSYNGFDRSPGLDGADARQKAGAQMASAVEKPYAALREAHVRDHQRLFRRVSIDLGSSPAGSLPTDERLKRYPQGTDPAARGAAFPVRALPAHRQLAPGNPTGKPAGDLERTGAPAVELELDDQHQYADELLAGGDSQPGRVPRAAAGNDPRPERERRENCPGEL